MLLMWMVRTGLNNTVDVKNLYIIKSTTYFM